MKLKDSPLALPPPGEPIRIAVENQYDFTNLSELKIHWSLGEDKGWSGRTCLRGPEASSKSDRQRIVKDGEMLAIQFEESSRPARGRLSAAAWPRAAARSQLRKVRKRPVVRARRGRAGGAVCDHRRQGFPTGRDGGAECCGGASPKGDHCCWNCPSCTCCAATNRFNLCPTRLVGSSKSSTCKQAGDHVHLTIHGDYQRFPGRP